MGLFSQILRHVSLLLLLSLLTEASLYENVLNWAHEMLVTDICKQHPDACRNVSQIITSKGYPCEVHTVKTEDGYLLGVHRIPHGRKLVPRANRPVVYVQHGLLSSSADWVANSASESLGFLLADSEFDVWLGNSRGNTYSRRHVKMSPHSNAFWEWSFDEMARYDIPDTLNYILKYTGQQDMFYVGHSQGTLIAFAAFSQNQNLANKIKLFVALGPVTNPHHMISPIKYLTAFPDEVIFIFLGRRDFLPNDWLIKLLDEAVCSRKYQRVICDNILFLMAGYDQRNLNQTRLPVYIAHTPAGTSVQNLAHFGQVMRSNKFQMYDYGSANMKHYGQATPPVYNVTQMKTPVVLYSGENDWLATPEDVKLLRQSLPNVKASYQLQKWNHLDFLWAYNANRLVYRDVIKMFQN